MLQRCLLCSEGKPVTCVDNVDPATPPICRQAGRAAEGHGPHAWPSGSLIFHDQPLMEQLVMHDDATSWPYVRFLLSCEARAAQGNCVVLLAVHETAAQASMHACMMTTVGAEVAIQPQS